MSVTSLNRLWKKIKSGHSAQIDFIHRTPQRHPHEATTSAAVDECPPPASPEDLRAPGPEERDQIRRLRTSDAPIYCVADPHRYHFRDGVAVVPAAQRARTALQRPSS